MPSKKPQSFEQMSKEELTVKIEKGLKDIEEGRVYTSEEVDDLLKKKYGIE